MPTASQLGTCKAFKKRQLTGAQVDMQPPFDAGAPLLILNEVCAIRSRSLGRSSRRATSKMNAILAVPQRSALRTVGLDKCRYACALPPYTDFVSPLNKRILFNLPVRTQGRFGHGKPHSGLTRA